MSLQMGLIPHLMALYHLSLLLSAVAPLKLEIDVLEGGDLPI